MSHTISPDSVNDGGLSLQEIFDRGYAHILNQGKPCFDNVAGTCVYSDGNGNSCIVGGFLKPGLYTPSMDHCGGLDGNTLVKNALARSGVLSPKADGSLWASLSDEDERRITLLVSMQHAHDRNAEKGDGWTLEQFKGRMRVIAEDWALAVPAGE